jgi:hypothetical protein
MFSASSDNAFWGIAVLQSNPSLTAAVTIVLGVGLAIILNKYFSVARSSVTDSVSSTPIKDTPSRDYVFREDDVASVQKRLDSGAVSVVKLLVHPIKACICDNTFIYESC